jgi:FSR family fosmidomycin resistance protein-like MFS transporter
MDDAAIGTTGAPRDGEVETSASPGRILGSLMACHAVNDFYTQAVPPLLPAIQASFGLSYVAVSLIPFLTLATSALLQPTLGYLADRHIRRRLTMAVGFGCLALGILALGLSQSYLAVLGAALILGVGASTYHPQSATLLAHFFTKKRRGFAQGLHGIGNAVGFGLAPVVMSFLLARTDWHHAALWLAAPALVGVAIVALALRESANRANRGLLAGITRPLALLTVVNGLALATSAGYANWLPSYYHARGYSLAGAALLTAATSGAAFVAQPLGGSLSDWIGRRTLRVVALAGAAVSLGLFLIAPSIVWAVGFSVLVGFWTSLTPPVAMVYASELAAGQRTGTAVGVVWGMATSVSALALPLTGRIIDLAGGQIGPAYLALAVVAALASLLALRLPAG